MSGDRSEVVTPRFRMWLRPDGIVHLVWNQGVSIVLEDAVASHSAMMALTGGVRAPLLVDAHDSRPQDRATRLHFVERSDLVSAVALIVNTPLGRTMGKLFLNVSEPVAPTRLFGDDASAITWLQEFVRRAPDGDP
ncbi:DUF7793 family protein [Demequina lutea]|uniref:DUF7793 domain-containing protein n=1 Tax=Demequina lutea TaxID=431489 RepID=A0A7Y9ZC43_9MICO|nr:hypothetical protein [Demequina lutea]NYI41468.1 hypothetical protein [Demequina lutea]